MKKNNKFVEVFIRKSINSLGEQGEIIKISPGYARNYLIPNNLVELVNKNNYKNIINIQNQLKYKEKVLDNYFTNLKSYMDKIAIFSIKKKAGKSGLIFGRISEKEIIKLIYSLTKYEANKKQIIMPQIKSIGAYQIKLNINKKITISITLQIIPY